MTQDHPAVVNLALVGSDSNTTNILNEQVHSFRYDVISNETGGSHKYTIELINYDDSFMGGLIDMYATIIGSDGSLVDSAPIIAGAKDSAEASFPKLVIEWGYPGQMSGVHVAQISNIQYKYTQGKERILIIDATDVTEIFELYTKNIVKTPTRKFSLEVGTSQDFLPSSISNPSTTTPVSYLPLIGLADANGAPYEFHEIIFQILRDLIGTIPGIHIQQIPPFEHYGFGDVIQSLVDGFVVENESMSGKRSKSGTNAIKEYEDAFRRMHNPKPGDGNAPRLKREAYYGHYANSIKKLFDYFGITFKNPGFDGEAAIANKQQFVSMETERVLEDGSYGYATNVISSEQIASNPNGLKAIQHAASFSSGFTEHIDFNSTANNDHIVGNIERVATFYWNFILGNLSNPYPPQDLIDLFKAEFRFTSNDDNLFKSGTPVYRLSARFDVPHNMYGTAWGKRENLRALPFEDPNLIGAVISPDDITASRGAIGTVLSTLTAAREQANQDLMAGGLSEAVIGVPEQAVLYPSTTYEKLTETEKADLEYNNMKYYYESEKGTDVMKSAQIIIDKFNGLMPDGLKIGMMKESIRYQQSFKDIQDKIVDSTGSVPTTVVYLGNVKDIARSSKQGLPPFNTEKSNPRADDLNTLMYTADPSTPYMLKLSYGGQGANVKYFDFASDHRYLANIVTSFVTVNTFSSFSEYLSAASIKRYLSPMLTVMDNFWDKYQSNKSIIDNVFKTHRDADKFDNVLDTELQNKLTVMRAEFVDFSQALDSQVLDDGNIIPINAALLDIFSTEEFKKIIDFIVNDKLSTEAAGPELETIIKQYEPIRQQAIEEDLSTRIKIFFGALSNATYVSRLFHKSGGEKLDPETPPEEFIAEALMTYSATGSADPTVISLPAPKHSDSFVYHIQDRNLFDVAAAFKIEKNLAVQSDFLNRNARDVVSLKVKTLGIPEMDTYREVSAPRRIEFKIENIKNSYVTNKYQHHSHWLSGYYNPIAISHTIDSKGGYSTEFKLWKENGSNGVLSGK